MRQRIAKFLDQVTTLTIDKFIDAIKRYYPHLSPAPESPPQEIIESCLGILEHPEISEETIGPISYIQAATLIGWLVFRHPVPNPMINEQLAISARSRKEGSELLRKAESFAAIFLQAVYSDSIDARKPGYHQVHKAVFVTDTTDELEVIGASRCVVYSRRVQFCATILFQQEGISTTGIDKGIIGLRILYRVLRKLFF
jgi:hypothetical protein